jgi:hypothetical protein
VLTSSNQTCALPEREETKAISPVPPPKALVSSGGEKVEVTCTFAGVEVGFGDVGGTFVTAEVTTGTVEES